MCRASCVRICASAERARSPVNALKPQAQRSAKANYLCISFNLQCAWAKSRPPTARARAQWPECCCCCDACAHIYHLETHCKSARRVRACTQAKRLHTHTHSLSGTGELIIGNVYAREGAHSEPLIDCIHTHMDLCAMLAQKSACNKRLKINKIYAHMRLAARMGSIPPIPSHKYHTIRTATPQLLS